MLRRVILFTLSLLLLSACAAPQRNEPEAPPAPTTAAAPPAPAPLRVGVSTNFPPIIFKQNGRILGVEADLARGLAQELGRPVKFVELTWTRQIPGLLAGDTDIIMSGMSVTPARQVRIAFTDPYFRSGIFAMMRAEDRARFNTRNAVLQTTATVGVVKGTTGERFVQENMPGARIWNVSKGLAAPLELSRYKIDLFIHDGPAIAWIISEHEGEMAALREPLNEELLAWGVRREDAALRNAVNGIIRRWNENGTLSTVLKTWLPFVHDAQE